MKAKKNLALVFLIVCLFTFSSILWSLDLPQQQQEPPQTPPSSHGSCKGEKFCYNFGKEKNCDCKRECVNGVPQEDRACCNYCFKDKCKCRTKCNS